MARILIVEDDAQQSESLSDLLYELGFDTAVADNGLTALSILAQLGKPDNPLPNIILLDLHMPGMDGWTLREKLKEDPRYCTIPIIIMSGDTASIEVPAEGHLMKPLSMETVVAALSRQN